MSVIVTGAGVVEDEWLGRAFVDLATLEAGADVPPTGLAVDFANDQNPEALAPYFARIAVIRVGFPGMGDGRGFSIAHLLRKLGYQGRLRAAGPLISDQLRAALRVGFDEIELPDAMAARQPGQHWRVREQGSYQKRLLG
jgi:uncharacterized protein (DUF934 family)